MSEFKNELETTNYFLCESFWKSNSITSLINNASFAERMKYNNEDKEKLIDTIKILMDMVSSVRNYGFSTLSNYTDKLPNTVARHAIKLITSQSLPTIDSLGEIVLPYLVLSNIRGKELLESILVYECIYDAVRGVGPTLIEYKLYGYLGMLPE